MNLTEIFCDVDDFCKVFEPEWNKELISEGIKMRQKKSGLSLSEVITIVIYFHLSGYRKFKDYYLKHVFIHLKSYFPNLVSYNRFVELSQEAVIPLVIYLKTRRMGKVSGISFIDSTILRVCDNRRIHSHKVFKGIAQRGRCSLGWFFGFKVHLTVNDKGELLSFDLTAGNVDDRDKKVISKLTKRLYGKLFGDKGYLSKELFETLFKNGVKLVTKVKRNMKNKLMDYMDKILLRKRALIEAINDELKNICNIEHSRHRSVANFLVNLFSGLAAYSFLPKKPSLNLNEFDKLPACV